jgi:hypothetical protein
MTTFMSHHSQGNATMHRSTHTSQSSIGRDFMTFGNEGLSVHRANERRAAERHQNQINAALQASRPPPWVRRWLGSLTTALGTRVSGKAAQIQERETLLPTSAPETEMAATR